MTDRQNSFASWIAEREAMEAWCQQVDAALPPFERALPRDRGEASFLRSIGTPDAVIGPERVELSEEEAMALAVEAQHATRPRKH